LEDEGSEMLFRLFHQQLIQGAPPELALLLSVDGSIYQVIRGILLRVHSLDPESASSIAFHVDDVILQNTGCSFLECHDPLLSVGPWILSGNPAQGFHSTLL
jgi:hypothetical protein